MSGGARLLNVGCGATFHPYWTNLDFNAVSAGIVACDVRRGLPFADGTFEACYSSHVLEHLTVAEAERLLREMHRVTRAGGIARVVVPDLERVARDYLQSLQRALDHEPGGEDDYDWMLIQLLDQSVRRASGGAMSRFWRDRSRCNTDFVVARAGLEAEAVIAQARAGAGRPARSLIARLRSRAPAQLIRELRQRGARALVGLTAGREAMVAFTEGLFRNSGEIHHWMYDRYSLARSLRNAGFSEPRVMRATESLIPGFAAYDLDVVHGRVRKPDSLFMEAVRDAVQPQVERAVSATAETH
jgi:SAM-dependent methyltransferase